LRAVLGNYSDSIGSSSLELISEKSLLQSFLVLQYDFWANLRSLAPKVISNILIIGGR
jgi:hypothetical protein